MSGWSRETIKIVTTEGERNIRAWCLGGLAVHKGFKASGWRITHRPTGMSFGKATGNIPDEDKAVAIATEVSALLDWSTAQTDEMRQAGQAIFDIAKRHGCGK